MFQLECLLKKLMPKLFKRLTKGISDETYEMKPNFTKNNIKNPVSGPEIDKEDFSSLYRSIISEEKSQLSCPGEANFLVEMNAVRWFLSFFCVDLPIDSAQTVLDLFIIDGPIVLLRTGLAILSVLESAILGQTTLAQIQSGDLESEPYDE